MGSRFSANAEYLPPNQRSGFGDELGRSPVIPISWLLLSFVIGYLGRNRVLGFWGSFLVSLLLSPLIGALAVAATSDLCHHH